MTCNDVREFFTKFWAWFYHNNFLFWRDFLTLIVFWKTNPQWSFSFWAELKSPTTFESTSSSLWAILSRHSDWRLLPQVKEQFLQNLKIFLKKILKTFCQFVVFLFCNFFRNGIRLLKYKLLLKMWRIPRHVWYL